MKISLAIIVSRFNEEITGALLESALARLAELKFPKEHYTVVHVPGAVEIPITAQAFAKTKRYHAIICLGAVIRGETTHYDYVCEQVSQGCQHVMLDHELPVIFGVLTTEDEQQAEARINKGAESVDAALEMIGVLQKIRA